MSNPYAPKKRKTVETTTTPDVVQEETIEVPEGTISTVMKWVGDDATKAKIALDEEVKKEKPRTSLIEQLEDVIG